MAGAGVPVEEHLARVLALVAPLPPAEVPLGEALGLVTAEDVTAAEPLPRFDHAAMDGYAVRAADVAAAFPEDPVKLPVVGSVAAGSAWSGSLEPGTALRIMTGAAVPAGADLVVPFEWTDGDDPVLVRRSAGAGRHIRRAGEDVVAGAVAVPAGTSLAPRHLGLLASVGRPRVVVRPRPRVALVSTGAELVATDTPTPAMPADAVRDSNTVTLAAACRALGAEVTSFGPVPDDPHAFLEQLARAAAVADLVVTTGGISAGDHDVVKAALAGRADTWFGPVAVRPGRPQGCGLVAYADRQKVPWVALPGTPVAAYTSFCLFVSAAIDVLAGRAPVAATAPLAAPVEADTDRTVVLPGGYDDAGAIAVLPGHAGHSQGILAAADALLVVPPRGRLLPKGEPVRVIGVGGPGAPGGQEER